MLKKQDPFLLTVTSFQAQASRNAVNDGETDDMTAIILDETFELLDLLLNWVPYVLLTFGIHIDIWSPDTDKL